MLPRPEAWGHRGSLQFPRHPLTVPRSLRRRILGHSLQVWSAVRGLRLVSTGSASSWPRPARVLLTTLQASLNAADRPVARPLSRTVFLRFDAEISLDAGSAATEGPGVSSGWTCTSWLS